MNSFKSRIGIRLLTSAATLLVLATGCANNPSMSHVTRVEVVGTKFGVAQNPTTGAYELGLTRVQAEVTWIPMVTDSNGVPHVPEVVSRYEVSSHSAVFGNVGLTSTLATGSNAVQTQVGGATPPINAGVGTGSNLTPLSH